MDVSIIIVNYNTYKLTSECIDSVIKYTSCIMYEIILVDNGSKDGSKEYFGNNKQIKYVYSEENLGFGRANNLGAKIASGKYLFFLNSDTLLTSNAILQFYKNMERDANIAAIGAQLIWPNNTLQESFFSFPSLGLILKDCFGLISHTPKINKNNKSIIFLKNKFISGADLFITHELFNRIGGFYPGFFMYYEETDLQYRIKKRNLKIAFNPNIKIIHYNGGSQINKVNKGFQKRKQYSKKIAIFNKSRILYFSRNKPKCLFILRCILTIGILLRIRRLLGHIQGLIKDIWRKQPITC